MWVVAPKIYHTSLDPNHRLVTGDGHFLAYTPSWWYFRPSLGRAGMHARSLENKESLIPNLLFFRIVLREISNEASENTCLCRLPSRQEEGEQQSISCLSYLCFLRRNEQSLPVQCLQYIILSKWDQDWWGPPEENMITSDSPFLLPPPSNTPARSLGHRPSVECCNHGL